MTIYALIPQKSPLQFYQLLQANYPSYTVSHDVLSDKVTASGMDWHWTATTDFIGDNLTIIGTYKGTAKNTEKALMAFKDALEAQQMVYLLEYEVPTIYGHTSQYLEHPAYRSAMAQQSVPLAK